MKKDYRNRLQYAYSMAVFLGVLFTAYLMVSQETGSLFNRNVQTQDNSLKSFAGDPAIEQLILVEKALAKIQKNRSEKANRIPTQSPALPIPNR